MRRCPPLIVSIVLLSAGVAVGAAPADSFLCNGVTAHRGNSGEYPENTIAAFRSAIDLGVDWVELDVFRTRDGKLVVIHDRTTGRVGDKDLVVPESTYAELLAVDVATAFRREREKSIEECPKHSIPLLEEALALVLKQNRTRVSIQPKMDCVADAVGLVKRLEAEKWVGFNDGNLEYMAKVKELAPELTVFWDRSQADIDRDVGIAREHGFESLVLHSSLVSGDSVAAIHEARLEAGVWTVNDESAMERFLDMGIDRIYTDYPRRLLAVKTRRTGFGPAQCEGAYPRHLQGICVSPTGAIYWSFTDVLVKSDAKGTVLKSVPVANHHGDLCHHDGNVYVAVNLGKFNDPQGNADSWVYVYDADSLVEVARHAVPEAVYGAGGMDFRDGRFMIVGGLPPGIEENFVFEYDADFRFVRKHVVASGYTLMGIQTAAFADGCWWFGCYGKPQVLLKTDESFKLLGRYEFDCSLGITGLQAGRFLVARGSCEPQKGCTGNVSIARADATAGLVVEKVSSTDPSPAGARPGYQSPP